MAIQEKLHDEIEQLRTYRDELRVQANLAAKEIRDLFDEAEGRWARLETHLKGVERETRDSLHEVSAAGRELIDEIRDAYKRIRAQL